MKRVVKEGVLDSFILMNFPIKTLCSNIDKYKMEANGYYGEITIIINEDGTIASIKLEVCV